MSSPTLPRRLPKDSTRDPERGRRTASAASLLAGANESLDGAAPLRDQLYGELINVEAKEDSKPSKRPSYPRSGPLKSAMAIVTKKKRSLSNSSDRSRSPSLSRAAKKKETFAGAKAMTAGTTGVGGAEKEFFHVGKSASHSNASSASGAAVQVRRSSIPFLEGLDLDVPSLDLDAIACAAGSPPVNSLGYTLAMQSHSSTTAVPLHTKAARRSQLATGAYSPQLSRKEALNLSSGGSNPNSPTSLPSPLSESHGSDSLMRSMHKKSRHDSSSGSTVTLPDYSEHKRRTRRAKALASRTSSPLSSGRSDHSGGSSGGPDSSEGAKRKRRGRKSRRRSEEALHSWEHFYSMHILSTEQLSDFVSSDEQSDTPRGVDQVPIFDNVEELEYVAEFNGMITNLSDYIEDEIQASSVIPKLDMVEGICWMVAGTPYQLADYLLGPRQDSALVHTFLLTHPYFLSSADLFKYLCYKFASSDSAMGDSALMEGCVVNLINRWKDNGFYNFFGQPELVKLLKLFVAFVSRNSPQWAQHLRFKQRSLIQTTAKKQSPPMPHLPADMTKISFLALHPLEIARQLTLIDQALFRAVPATELLGARWTKPGKDSDAPNIRNYTKQFNKITYWVATEILTALNHLQRIEIIQRFIQVATELRTLQNFNSMMAVHAALNMNSVQRLKDTWKAVPDKYRRRMASIETMMDSRKNFSNYRKVLAATRPPLIPFQALLLGDLAMCENMDGKLDDGAVNFYKMIEVAKHMQQILDMRAQEYNLYEVPAIKHFLKEDILVLEDEPLYKLSQYCQHTSKARNR